MIIQQCLQQSDADQERLQKLLERSPSPEKALELIKAIEACMPPSLVPYDPRNHDVHH